MNIHIRRWLFVVAVVLGAVAMFALGFFVALGVRSVVAGPDSAPAASAPNPGHSWSEVGDLPGTMWHSNNDGPGSGLDADTLDGLQSTQIQDADDYVSNAGYCTAAGNADTLDGQHGAYYRNASNMNAGTLGTSYYSAQSDLSAEGYLGNAEGDLAQNNGTLQTNLNAYLLDGQQASAFASASHNHDTSYWTLTGNSGTTSSNFLGTTDNQALELWVNGARALRLEPKATSPDVIGGYSGNSVWTGAYAATIGGGGASGTANRVYDNYGAVGGGANNAAGNDDSNASSAYYATVAGGSTNTASGSYATVGGGGGNTANGECATVGGGSGNNASGNASTVGGGATNTADWDDATVGGGSRNSASAYDATVSGGLNNNASGIFATVAGGLANDATLDFAAVGGGWDNVASGGYATVGGGGANSASMGMATVGGGGANSASGPIGTVAGGYFNLASGEGATVPGGRSNTAQGTFSLAAGYRAKANGAGCFVWGDSTDADITCNDDNRFIARASGGVYLHTDSTLTSGCWLAAGSNSWSCFSDRNLKENFTPVDGQEVLASLADVPIATWNYEAQDAAIRHMGPVAQDFYSAFGLGESDTAISTVDADGVALAAIQGLYQLTQEQGARIQALEADNADLHQQLDDLEARVTALDGGAGTNGASAGPLSSSLTAGGMLLAGLAFGGLVLVQRRRAGGGR